jgi:threonine dehydrogenase-like Zn-dependent dehydrogenase
MGRGFAGRVVSAPSESNLSPGQAVMVDPRIYCNNCSRCNAGSTQGCPNLGFKGLSGTGGGFSEFVAVDVKLCYPLPDNIDSGLAALIEPLAVAWHAIALSEVSYWSTKAALILGGGPIGIACVLVLRARGCKQILISEPTTTRAAQNKQVVDVVLNPISDSIGDKCREVTQGEGIDVVFDCAGVQNGFDAGMDALRYNGLYMNVALWGAPVSRVRYVCCPDRLIKDGHTFQALYHERDYNEVCIGLQRQRFVPFVRCSTIRQLTMCRSC